MNKLLKISLISGIVVSVGITSFGKAVFAQESSSEAVQNTNSETKDDPQTTRGKSNQDLRSSPVGKKPLPSDTQDMSSRSTEQKRQDVGQRDLNVVGKNADREKKIKEKCDSVGVKIVNHQDLFKSKSQDRIAKYNQIVSRLDSFSLKLSENGVDVSTYNSYVSELKLKIDAFSMLNQNYTILFTSKANTGEFCNNKERLSTEVDVRKERLQLVIEKDKEIRTYIKDTIVSYLKTVKPERDNVSNPNKPNTSNSEIRQ
jgi:hypothetical protein